MQIKMDLTGNVLCCGCLCAGRKMVPLNDFRKKEYFWQIIEEIPMPPHTRSEVMLCWECEALISRFAKFKKQAKQCYDTLSDYAIQNLNTTHLNHTPRLSTHRVVNISVHPDSNPQYEVTIDVKREIETLDKIKEEDVVSTYSDNLDVDDDCALIEYKSVKKKKKKKMKKKRKKKENAEEEVIEEVMLTPEELAEERRTLAAREDYVNAMFRCERCIVSFPNADDLSDHVKIKHDPSKCQKCEWCACTFSSEAAHGYHAAKHRKRHRCRICQQLFPSNRAAQKHYYMLHRHVTEMEYEMNGATHENGQLDETPESNNGAKQEPAQFPCELCEKTFRWKTSLRKHMETHRIETGQKRKPYCEPCRLSFTTTSNLQKHVKTSSKHQIQLKLRKLSESGSAQSQQAHIEEIKRSVNNARQLFPCPQCDKRFQWRGNLARHLHTHKARAAGSLVCLPCNRTFSSIATYNQHMTISKKHVSEDDFKYMCSDCGKKFANKTRLKDHIDWEHLKNFVHTCNVCQKVFKSHTSLYLHKQVVHKKDSAEHLCDHCGKHFPNHAKLRSHIVALHSASAPYKCAICCARFSWHSCLSRHARRVHKPKPSQE